MKNIMKKVLFGLLELIFWSGILVLALLILSNTKNDVIITFHVVAFMIFWIFIGFYSIKTKIEDFIKNKKVKKYNEENIEYIEYTDDRFGNFSVKHDKKINLFSCKLEKIKFDNQNLEALISVNDITNFKVLLDSIKKFSENSKLIKEQTYKLLTKECEYIGIYDSEDNLIDEEFLKNNLEFGSRIYIKKENIITMGIYFVAENEIEYELQYNSKDNIVKIEYMEG